MSVLTGNSSTCSLRRNWLRTQRPSVELASGQSVSDLAGNESTDRRLDGIELNDGILPTFTVTLSGGSGLNEDIDGEGSSELTNTDRDQG